MKLLPIPMFPGYVASDSGHVYSMTGLKPRRLKPYVNKNGYLSIVLRDCQGKLKYCYLHRLILVAFKGPCPPRCQADHCDGNKTNNRPGNLRWLTAKQNCQHKADLNKGAQPNAGEQSTRAKLKAYQIREIRYFYTQGGITHATLARRYKVSANCIRLIIERKTWKHV